MVPIDMSLSESENSSGSGVYEASRVWQQQIFDAARQAVDKGVILTVDGEVAIQNADAGEQAKPFRG
jgi:hypothetical protein